MRAFLATVLSVIAVGVLLIAYGLLAPRASAQAGMAGVPAMSVVYDPQTGTYQMARPVYAGDRLALPESGYGYPQAAPGRFVATPVGYNTRRSTRRRLTIRGCRLQCSRRLGRFAPRSDRWPALNVREGATGRRPRS